MTKVERNPLVHWVGMPLLAAGATAAIGYFSTPAAVDHFEPLHGGTADLVACQPTLDLHEQTSFPEGKVPAACRPWMNDVEFVHHGEDYVRKPGSTKIHITQRTEDNYVFPPRATFDASNEAGAQATDDARESKVADYQKKAAEVGGAVGLAGLFVLRGFNQWRKHRHPKPAKAPGAGHSGGPRPPQRSPQRGPAVAPNQPTGPVAGYGGVSYYPPSGH